VSLKDFKDAFDEIESECWQAWQWLKKLPAYRKSYMRFKRERQKWTLRNLKTMKPSLLHDDEWDPIPETIRRRFIRKWGFYPLINPGLDDGKVPIEFLVWVPNQLLDRPLDNGIRVLDREWECLVRAKAGKHWVLRAGVDITEIETPPLPKRIVLEIDPRKSPIRILLGIKDFLRDVRKVYRLGRPSQTGNLALEYRAYVLMRQGVSDSAIRKELNGVLAGCEERKGEYLDPTGSQISKVKRILRKAKGKVRSIKL